MSRRKLTGVVGLAAIAGVTMLVWAAPAFAHVTVDPSRAPKGSHVVLAFRVANESEDASTTKVEIQMPEDKVLGEVAVEPAPGWTYAVTTRELSQPITTDDGEISEVADTITFDGGEIKPGEFQEFRISVGPLPNENGPIEFKTIQTYDDGTEVKWIESETASSAAPEHPAPVLRVGGAGGSGSSSSGGSTKTIAIAAAVVSVLAIALAGFSVYRGRPRYR